MGGYPHFYHPTRMVWVIPIFWGENSDSYQSLAPSRAPPNAKPAQQEDSPCYASDPMPDYDNVFTD